MVVIPWNQRRILTVFLALAVVTGCSGNSGKRTETAAQLPPQGMAAIPAGCFKMGDSFGEGVGDEVPVHKVCLPAFYMDVHEVTNAEFAKCIGAGGCGWIGGNGNYYGNQKYDDYPVITFFWEEAKDYCAWAGKRLPTEAEWEYAARGGLKGKRYPRGDTMSCSGANYGRYVPSPDCYDSRGYNIPCPRRKYRGDGSPCVDSGGRENREQKVGSYAANGYGLYDMDGNVREWVNDWYSANYYSGRPNPDDDPPGPGKDEAKNIIYHVVRGGGWASVSPLLIRVSFRDIESGLSYGQIGFRCAADPRPEAE